MEHTGIEVFLLGEMGYARHKRAPQRPIIGPSREDFVDGRVIDGRVAIGIFWYG
jgi:hypothetical protein